MTECDHNALCKISKGLVDLERSSGQMIYFQDFKRAVSDVFLYLLWAPGGHFNMKTVFPGIGILIIFLKRVMRQSYLIVGVATLTRQHIHTEITQWTHDAIIMSLLQQNDVAMSFWPKNDCHHDILCLLGRHEVDLVCLSLIGLVHRVKKLSIPFMISPRSRVKLQSFQNQVFSFFMSLMIGVVKLQSFKIEHSYFSLSTCIPIAMPYLGCRGDGDDKRWDTRTAQVHQTTLEWEIGDYTKMPSFQSLAPSPFQTYFPITRFQEIPKKHFETDSGQLGLISRSNYSNFSDSKSQDLLERMQLDNLAKVLHTCECQRTSLMRSQHWFRFEQDDPYPTVTFVNTLHPELFLNNWKDDGNWNHPS